MAALDAKLCQSTKLVLMNELSSFCTVFIAPQHESVSLGSCVFGATDDPVCLTGVCVCVFPADIKMSKASGEEKPAADYPGDSSGTPNDPRCFCTFTFSVFPEHHLLCCDVQLHNTV